jgi:carbamoyltransferase
VTVRRVLGLSAFFHDSAAAYVEDGRVVAAAQEERFTRRKQDPSFPANAARYCLDEAGIRVEELDAVVFYERPDLKFARLVATYLAFAPQGWESFRRAAPEWLGGKRRLDRILLRELGTLGLGDLDPSKLRFAEHHVSHAASAYYPSPFEDAAALTVDGVGEWATTTAALGKGGELTMLKELRFPHSVGLLYAAFTSYTGFRVNSGEYKVMGLAPYGEPKYAQLIYDHLVDLEPDGSLRLNQEYFDYCTGISMTSDRFHDLFGGPPREAETLLRQRDMDLAASVQVVTDEILLRMTRALADETGERRLCLAGGVALNCVTNGKILRDGRFDAIWIQPAAGDAGGAVGAALLGYHLLGGQPRRVPDGLDGMEGSYLGPEFTQGEIESRLAAAGARLETLADDAILEATADALVDGQAVGWFQGRMEFGPRALGNRSILGDPRSRSMQKQLNLKIKYREGFRPFAPSVLAEDAAEWFDLDAASPYMLLVADVRDDRKLDLPENYGELQGLDKLNVPRSEIPAVTHVDFSARIQTVHGETNPRYYELIRRFKERTGCGVLVNTSFNVRGEPIVCTPEDAWRCFMGTELDLLVAGNCLVRKAEQDTQLRRNYTSEFALD